MFEYFSKVRRENSF